MSDSEAPNNITAELGGTTVRDAYDRWSVQYDNDRNLTRDLDALVLRRQKSLTVAGGTVLEIGCGTGKNTAWLAEHAQSVVAMDFSAGMLSIAAKRVEHSNVRFVQHDVREHWPLPDASVDAVIGNLVLEHVQNVGAVYAEASRVLRDGGQLYFCELHPFRQWRGGQAHFTEQSSGDTVQVSAFVHSVQEYVNDALQHGFALAELGEWLEEDAAPGALPRLLSVLFTRAKR